MKLHLQGECEIRIQLSREDLERYQMTADELDYDSPRGKRVILELFDRARLETGFQTEGERIYIQLYPTACGGCELFVTKLEKEVKRVCFFFSDFDALYGALGQSHFPEYADLWRNEKKGHFYLLIPEDRTPHLFYEFGEKIKTPSSIFLRSRCRKLRWGERISDG